MKPLLWLPLLAILAACATPQETCIADATRDIKVLDALIANDLATLDRGYALERRTRIRPSLEFCGGLVPFGDGFAVGTSACIQPRARTQTVAEAVNLDVVARRLDSLERKRAELAARTEAGVSACRATYPPG